jgi:hypothetical protein
MAITTAQVRQIFKGLENGRRGRLLRIRRARRRLDRHGHTPTRRRHCRLKHPGGSLEPTRSGVTPTIGVDLKTGPNALGGSPGAYELFPKGIDVLSRGVGHPTTSFARAARRTSSPYSRAQCPHKGCTVYGD